MALIIKTKNKREEEAALFSAMISGRKSKLLSKFAKENFITRLLNKR